MTTQDDNIVSMLPSDEPPPTAAYELCPGPCHDGDTCFCALGMDLVHQGIGKLQEKWPSMSKGSAAFLTAEKMVQDAAILADVRFPKGGEEEADLTSRFVDMLISNAVGLAFSCFQFQDTADMDARFKAEHEAAQTIEHVLRARVSEFAWRLHRERRPATA